ncbi:MAG: universal stress protein [Vulcanimicrobiota bacterium]
MFEKVLVPLDGSEFSESVLRWLPFLAQMRPEPEYLVVRAFEPPSIVYLLPEFQVPTSHILSDDHLSGAIFEYLDRVKGALNELKVDTRMLIGEPASEILELSEDADLVIMASHGRGGLGRWLLGSVATKVARGIQTPLLVINGKSTEASKDPRLKTMVCPIDGSEVSERSLEIAGRLAQQFDCKLFLYRAVDQPTLQDSAVQELEALATHLPEGLEVECRVVETSGPTGIDRFAAECEADLICMGSHGKSGFQRWMLGSETEKVLQTAPCPVLVTH